MAHELTASALAFEHLGPWDLRLAGGTCLGISGPSGVGKSVLLRMLADLVPHSGQCWLDGVACADMPAPQWRKSVRYCAATPGWWAPAIREHFANPEAAARSGATIDLDPTLFDKQPDRLSTGEKQRFGLLRALEDDPAFLLLDEPTSALDDATTRQVEALIAARLEAGTGVVLVTHDTDQLRRLAHATLEIAKR